MNPVKLIATDLDGTLLTSTGTISERTCRAIQQSQRSGINIALVTARPPRSVRWIADRLKVSGIAICSNGAIIYDLANDSILHNERIAIDLVLELSRKLLDEDAGFSFATEHGDKVGYEPGYPQNPGFTHLIPPKVAALAELCADEVTKLIVHHPILPLVELMAQINRHLDGKASVTHSAEAFVEISAAGTSKASALAKLCKGLEVDRQQVIAFGDMPNDLPMLAFAGHAVAVGNAHPEVLRIANEVTSNNDDDGVARVIERLLAALDHEPHPVGAREWG